MANPAALLALAAALCSATPVGDDARDGFEAVVRAHAAAKSAGGYWTFKRKGAPSLRLKLVGVERETVYSPSAGLVRGLADFRDAAGKNLYAADVTADMGSERRRVKSLRWLPGNAVARTRRLCEDAARESAAPAPEPEAPEPEQASAEPGAETDRLPDVTLSASDGRETFMPRCPKAKCLTVVVAPWCPHCQKETKVLAALHDWLPPRGVEMRVVVAADSDEKVRDYAEKFGSYALLDPDSTFRVPGFPAFIISKDRGVVLNRTGSAPEDETDPARFAEALGLP